MRTHEGSEWNGEKPLVSRSDGLTVCTKDETHTYSGTVQTIFDFGTALKVIFTFRLDGLIDMYIRSICVREAGPNL